MNTEIKAKLTRHNQTPRKARLVANMIKGKNVKDAFDQLDFSDKKSSGAIKKLISSAVANAKHNFKLDQDDLFVKNITVNKSIVLKRGMPRAFGRMAPIKKRLSNLEVTLGVKGEKTK